MKSHELTVRQQSVWDVLASTNSYTLAAKHLGVNKGTVWRLAQRIIVKLGCQPPLLYSRGQHNSNGAKNRHAWEYWNPTHLETKVNWKPTRYDLQDWRIDSFSTCSLCLTPLETAQGGYWCMICGRWYLDMAVGRVDADTVRADW